MLAYYCKCILDIIAYITQKRRISLKRDLHRCKLVYAKETHVIFCMLVYITVCAYMLAYYCKCTLDIIAY